MRSGPLLLLLHSALALATAGAAAAQTTATAEYRVRFRATWSDATHPGAHPSNAHFSPFVGGTHDAAVRFWEEGGLASHGIESMAETGGTFALRQEIQAAIGQGHAGEIVLGDLIGSPGTSTERFRVTADHPLVTIVTMVAPSPDWFVGVDSLPLMRNGAWVDSLVVELYAWDAGTDSGTDFTSPDDDTDPQEPIALITGGPFFGTTPLGTFRFTRLASAEVYGSGVNPAGSMGVDGVPLLGETVSLFLDDPPGTLGLPSSAFVAIARAADPDGTLVPGLGLGPHGSPGEILIAGPFSRDRAPAYDGTAPSRYDLDVPNVPALAGETLYVQGFFVDPTGRVGVTDAVELAIGS